VITRSEILRRLRKNIEKGQPIIGTGAGTGISAKFEEAGGSDLIIVYNSGKYRMAGRGSSSGLLAFGDANAIVLDMAAEIIPVVKDTPVLAGVNGTDPFKNMHKFLKTISDAGYSGVQNFPTVGLLSGPFRQGLEETDLGFYKEVEMIAIANEMDMLTTPYVFNTQEAIDMAKVGADIIVAHMGVTVGGTIGGKSTFSWEETFKLVQEIRDAAVSINPDVIIMCHGGLISEPEDAERVMLNTTGVHGFYGASSAERLPVETAITNHIKKFKSIRVK